MTLLNCMVPFIPGLPSIRARVVGVSPDDQYILFQEYDTQDKRGKWIHVKNYYYRDRHFIDSYWLDVTGGGT